MVSLTVAPPNHCVFVFIRIALSELSQQDDIQRRTEWGVQGGKRQPKASHPPGGPLLKQPRKAVTGMIRPQGVQR
jgi:hypothetical protein